MTEILEQTDGFTLLDVVPYDETDDGNKDRRTHIVRPYDNPSLTYGQDVSGQQVVDNARFLGKEVNALCGYKFVPKHNPEKFDACQSCIDLAASIMQEHG